MRAGRGEPAEHVGGRLRLGQRPEQAPRREAVGQARPGGCSRTSGPPTRRSERSGGPAVAKLSRSRSASKVAGSSIRWASSTIRSGRSPRAAAAASAEPEPPERAGERGRVARRGRRPARRRGRRAGRRRAWPGKARCADGPPSRGERPGQQGLARPGRPEDQGRPLRRAPARSGPGAGPTRGSAGRHRPRGSPSRRTAARSGRNAPRTTEPPRA